MVIVLLSGASSIHTIRWANGLSCEGHEVHVITQHPPIDPFLDAVRVHQLPYRGVLGYFIMVPAVKKLLSIIKPDIVNAHYASGYATTARLVGFHPWLLSVWGSDVYDFPRKTPLHSWLVRKNIYAADHVASTSHCMADQTLFIAPKLSGISVTPFGVDINFFDKIKTKGTTLSPRVTIGTVKAMESKYGIDTLIEAYAYLLNKVENDDRYSQLEFELRLVGTGSQVSELKSLADRLGVADSVSFIGRVPHFEVPQELAKLDIYVALSRLDSESFGVAVLEAGAAGLPVIVSDAGGLPEVTLDRLTGLVIPRENPDAAAEALMELVDNPTLRFKMGICGQEHVKLNYSWSACIQIMLGIYNKTIQDYNNDKILE